jgi:uncharacterized repeat protein (TIGR01451 family)
MTSSESTSARPGTRGFGARLLFALVLLAGASMSAQAENCSDYPNGLLDGAAGTPAPVQLQIDRDCTIRNYSQSNPFDTNINFYSEPGNPAVQRYLVVFDSVYYTGQMSCNDNDNHNHRIWFANGTIATNLQPQCRSLFIPVEKIDKQNPPGNNTATIGVPFTYRLTMPVLWDPVTGSVINSSGSLDTLHGTTIVDDLNATLVDLTYLSHVAYWEDDGQAVDHTFTNVGGVLTFDNFDIIEAGRQIIVEITVVLDDSPVNTSGKTFVNTAKWDFGRLIDNVFYEPLPGESGISPPMTIVAPDLVVTKTGPATLNVAEWGNFTLDVQNAGLGDAWNVALVDRLPDGPNAGMCDLAPEILSAQIFAADGVTPVPGKGPLLAGSDYTLTWNDAPQCELTMNALTAAAVIGGGERLIITYRSQLDAGTVNGATLTNVAGATQWFNGDSGNPDRVAYNRVVNTGTVGTADHQDAHTVTVALSGYIFEKTVANLSSGADPTATAEPGDTLRYTLRLQTTIDALTDASLRDELDALNALPAFAPGTLNLVSYPAGANVGNTSATGGANGTGLIDIRNLDVPAFGEIQIQFDVTLADALPNGTIVANQSTARLADNSIFALSDDPNVNGQASPTVAGDEDPTRLTVVSGPLLRIHKISTDLTDDPTILLPGETLRYTITVANIGTEDATGVTLRDQIPVNTSYVAGSTTLNGAAVADVSGTSPLVNGMQIHAPADPTPGVMPADGSAANANVATITFDVIVDPSVVQGTVLSNQGFVSATTANIANQPSDDPDTALVNDPTRDIVGYLPLLFAAKDVELAVDAGTPGIVDPGDVLHYTIRIDNSGALAATGVVLTDAVPANTTYVADSTMLNGLPVGQPDGGVSPLAAGIDISSSDLTPPLPGAGAGTISPGASAVLEFDLRVDDATPTGTLISNQAEVASVEVATVLTDGDGNPATGPEPTVVVVGDGQLLTITKQAAVVGGGAAVAGATLEYTVRVTNVASVPAFYVALTDDIAMASPGYLTYVADSATLDGSTNGVTVNGTLITADYSTLNGPLAPGASTVLRFRAVIDPTLAIGTTVTNTGVVTWNTPQQTAMASVSVAVGGTPGSGIVNGIAWHDADFDLSRGTSERALDAWTVELYRNSNLVHATLTDTDGVYRISGLVPNYGTTDVYELRFRAPGAGANTAALGVTDSDFTDYPQRIADIVVRSGDNLQNLNLPINPNGVVYDAFRRVPITGATVNLMQAGSSMPLPASCFDDPVQQGQVTLADGWYRFDLNFADPACPSGGSYLLEVTVSSAYTAGFSQLIPPTSSATTAAFDVPSCPAGGNDAVPTTAQHCEAVASEFAPGAGVAARSAGTRYHVHLVLDGSQPPGSSQLFNNHLAIDPVLEDVLTITKTTPMLNVSRGQLVPYTITLTNADGIPLDNLTIVDRYPAGFRYIEGSARIDGAEIEPTLLGQELHFSDLSLDGSGRHELVMLLAVGAGVSEGEFTNRAQAMSSLIGSALSGEASATVRVIPDATFDCTDVTGKVFADANRNGLQDAGETGLAGVRLVTTRGLHAITDAYGRYHITCAVTPREDRGSNFVVKLDDRTLPSGYRLSTEPVRVQRATRGKALKVNFGASIHRVIGLDMADAVFEPGTTEMRLQWRPRVGLLLKELQKAPAVLRISYLADLEDADLVDARMQTVKKLIMDEWKTLDCCYDLTIEPEVFWRLGAPPDQPNVRIPAGR